MQRYLVTTIIFMLILSMASLTATTIYVPDEYATIQDAIDASANGDVIIVRPGTYVENVDFVGKAITVMSELDPQSTFINGGQLGSVIIFKSGKSVDSRIIGFTIENGSGTISSWGANVGGGIYCCQNSSPTIEGNIIRNNNVTDSASNGGGIYCIDNSSPVIRNNIIYGNYAEYSGGGIGCSTRSLPEIINNTILSNSVGIEGGGVACYYTDSVDPLVITNTILFQNSASLRGNELALTSYYCPATVEIKFSNLEGGNTSPSVFVHSGSTLIWGSGMIDADPLFVDASNDDFRFTWDSPCRNSGDNAAVTESTDFEGDPRIAEGVVDMGADEFHVHLYYIGEVKPGKRLNVKVIGTPGEPVTLAMGTEIQDPLQQTPYGDLYLTLPINYQWKIGTIGADGTLDVRKPLPWT